MSALKIAVVQIVLQVGKGARSMARRFGRRALTVSREIRRQEARSGSPPRRQELPRVPRRCVRGHRLTEGTGLFQFVRDHLAFYRSSAQQIAAKLLAIHLTTPAGV